MSEIEQLSEKGFADMCKDFPKGIPLNEMWKINTYEKCNEIKLLKIVNESQKADIKIKDAEIKKKDTIISCYSDGLEREVVDYNKLAEDNDNLFMENEFLKSQLEENNKIRHKSHSNNKALRDLMMELCDIDNGDIYKYKIILSMYKSCGKECGEKMEKELGIKIPEWMK